MDGDGDTDLVGTAQGVVEWFANDGSGQFSEVTGRGTLMATGPVEAVGDTDGDGDPDFLILDPPGFYQGYFTKRYNRYRQLEVPRAPRLGGTLDVDVHLNDGGSGPNRLAALFIDVQTSTPIRLVPFGTWHLSLVTALQLGRDRGADGHGVAELRDPGGAGRARRGPVPAGHPGAERGSLDLALLQRRAAPAAELSASPRTGGRRAQRRRRPT